jgi:hypothetical protein
MPNDIKGIMGKEVAGLPTWVWVIVVGAGIAAAYIVPKFLNKGTTAPATTGTGDSSGSGLGLAVDPTTGLPYAVEGLVPGGGLAGGGNTTTPVTNPVTPPTTTPVTTPFNPFKPVLPQGTKVPATPGSIFTYQGQQYTIVTGPGGRIWGALGKMSLSQAQNAPIAPNSKVLLTAPASYYKPGAVAPPISYGQSPIYAGFYEPLWPGGVTQKRIYGSVL